MYDTDTMGKTKKLIERAIAKTITLTPKHQRFIEAKGINLSRFVQKALENEMETQGWKEG